MDQLKRIIQREESRNVQSQMSQVRTASQSLVVPAGINQRMSKNLETQPSQQRRRFKSSDRSHSKGKHKKTKSTNQSNQGSKGKTYPKSGTYLSATGAKTWTGLTTQEIITAKRNRQKEAMLSKGVLPKEEPQIAYQKQIELKKQEKIKQYNLEYNPITYSKKSIPFEVSKVYVPDIISDKKANDIFDLGTNSESKAVQELEERKIQEIENIDYTYEQLQELDGAAKNEQMIRILNEDAQVAQYIQNVLKKCESVQDKIVHTEYQIDDTKEDWDQSMLEINENLYKNAVHNGITTEQFKFLQFKITDLDKDYQDAKERKRQERIRDIQIEQQNKSFDIDKRGSVLQISHKVDRKVRKERKYSANQKS